MRLILLLCGNFSPHSGFPGLVLANLANTMLQCVVIGLQSTGEARTMELVDELNGELTDFISTAK